VRSLVLAMAIQQSFNSKGCPTFDVERFWRESLMTAECCKKIASSDGAADDTERDLAYSAGLCHNLGLMALTHIEPDRTNQVLQAHVDQEGQVSLVQLFEAEFETNHKIMTAELGRIWSLPLPMVAAYQYRALPQTHCDDRLGFVVAAAAAAVGNMDIEEDQRQSLAPWSETLGIAEEEIQRMASFGDEQKERVRSLASNMTR